MKRAERMMIGGLGIGVLHAWLVWMLLFPVVANGQSDGALTLDGADAVSLAAPGSPPGDKSNEKPDFPPFDEVGKDHEEIPAPAGAFWKLYYDKKADHLLAEIPKDKIGMNFLLAMSIAGGPQLAGYQWFDGLVQWQEMNKKLVLVEPDVRYKADEKSEVGEAIARTYTESIILATKIVSKKDGNPVIELDDVLKTNTLSLVAMLYRGSVDQSLSRYAKRKCFPHNLEITVDLAIMQPGSDGQKASVHYSFSEVPKNDYQPRLADDRVGYFLTAVKDWTRPHDSRTVFERYIHRWRLRKEEPSAKVSDVIPDDQIIFYIEKTVPKQYRHYVRQGILEWNKAFEAAGLRNAIQVRQQTDTNEFKDIDPEDVRYNFFRWIVSGRSFAMGPSRANPQTGQILDADIIWDDSMIRVWEARYARLAAQGPAADYDPQLTAFLKNNPQWNYTSTSEQMLPFEHSVSGVDMAWDHELVDQFRKHKAGFCMYANGIAHELAMGSALLSATGNADAREEYLGQAIRSVVSHEVGHTLGLRHNFKASTWKTMDQIMSTTDAETPVCASVMDYNPTMFAAKNKTQPVFMSTVLGPYDFWAIEYGYRSTDEEHKTEEDLLASIASRCAEPGLAYATDEDTFTFAPDPLSNRFDNGSDPIAFAKQRMEMVSSLSETIEEWAVKEGESYNELRKSFDMLIFDIGRSARFAARYVGGQLVNRDHKGDPNARPPFEMIPVAKQREALDFLVTKIFGADAFQFDPALLNKLGAGRWGHWDSDSFDSMTEYPIHDRVAAVQFWCLFQVLNPSTMNRVYDAELKVPASQDAMTVPELMTSVARAVWSEVAAAPSSSYSNRKPFINSFRRNLQRMYLELMINALLDDPGRTMHADVASVARMTLKGVSQQINEIMTGSNAANLDDFTRAHLDESKTRIDKALEARFNL